MDTLGFLELSSIAAGVKAADEMIKSGNIELIYAKASCPGKYYILMCGKVSDVQTSMHHAVLSAKSFVVASTILSGVDQKVIHAIHAPIYPENFQAIGIIESYTVAGCITAADLAVKAALVDIIDLRLGTGIGGKSFLVLNGFVEDVEAAVLVASEAFAEDGCLCSSVVIPNPSKKIAESLI